MPALLVSAVRGTWPFVPSARSIPAERLIAVVRATAASN
jgi:hypothetical protein